MRRALLALFIFAFVLPCTRAQSPPRASYPFVAEAVHEYCFGPGIDTRGVLPVVLEAHPPAPCASGEVRVLRATVLTGGAMQFQLRCGETGHLPFLAVARVGSCPHVRSAKSPTALPLLRKGQHARLTVINSGVRLSLPVVCLHAGRAGDRIRVRAVDGDRIFSALVTPTGQLVSELAQ